MTTKPTRGQSMTTLVFSILKILTGIIVMVLYKVVLDKALMIQDGEIQTSSTFGFYIFGLPFLIPGVFGLVAAFVKNGIGYGLYMAVCIIACVVDAVFCALSFTFLFAMASMGGLNCYNVLGECVCKSGNDFVVSGDPLPLSGDGCGDLNGIMHMSYGLCAMMIIGWVLCLAGSIISCASCCCGQREPQLVMMHSYPGQVVSVNTDYHPPAYPGDQFAPLPAQASALGVAEPEDQHQYKYNRMY